jgi:hypothetical protein
MTLDKLGVFVAAAGLAALLGAANVRAEASAPRSHVDALQGPPRPPPEAFSACEGKAEGAACQVEFHGEVHAGTCVAPNQQELFCLPNDMPPPPPEGGPPPPKA